MPTIVRAAVVGRGVIPVVPVRRAPRNLMHRLCRMFTGSRTVTSAWHLIGGAFKAMVVLAILPLSAVAQVVEGAWRSTRPPVLDKEVAPLMFLPRGSPAASFASSPAPVRLVDLFEDTEADRLSRVDQVSQCRLLAEIPGRTALDVLVNLPNGMMDWVASGLWTGPGRNEVISIRDPEGRSLLSSLLSCPLEDASARPLDDLVGQILLREQKSFTQFQDSGLSTLTVEQGLEDIDTGALMQDQNRILFDACRKLYFGRFGSRADEHIRDTAFNMTSWHTIDFAVAPVVVAGYLYVRGWDAKVEMLGLKCSFQVEPIRRILERLDGSNKDLVSAASVEVGLGDFPVKAIMSVGIMDGDAVIDFIGVGMSLGKAKQVVTRQNEDFHAAR